MPTFDRYLRCVEIAQHDRTLLRQTLLASSFIYIFSEQLFGEDVNEWAGKQNIFKYFILNVFVFILLFLAYFFCGGGANLNFECTSNSSICVIVRSSILLIIPLTKDTWVVFGLLRWIMLYNYRYVISHANEAHNHRNDHRL